MTERGPAAPKVGSSVAVGVDGARRAGPAGLDAGQPELVTLLRGEIERDGPITFAHFMRRALYEPGLGYYSAGTGRATRSGDFLTAPELHPIFGHAVARQLHEMWQRMGEPALFTLREHGAGSGTLAAAVVDGLTLMRSPLRERLRYQPVEVPGRADAISAALARSGALDVLDGPSADGPMEGCALANEFVDALPVHRVAQRGGRLRELFVGLRDGRLVEVEGEPSSPDLAHWFDAAGVALAEGQVAEVNLAMLDWVGDIAGALHRGYALILDYGAEPAQLYGPDRRAGTLRAFRDHHVSSDALGGVGRQDLTAHVDLAALRHAALGAGLSVLGTTSQAEFLVGCGLEELLAMEQAALPDEWEPRLLVRSAVRRLLDPRQLGGYAVLVLGRDVPADPPLRGLSFSLPPRL